MKTNSGLCGAAMIVAALPTALTDGARLAGLGHRSDVLNETPRKAECAVHVVQEETEIDEIANHPCGGFPDVIGGEIGPSSCFLRVSQRVFGAALETRGPKGAGRVEVNDIPRLDCVVVIGVLLVQGEPQSFSVLINAPRTGPSSATILDQYFDFRPVGHVEHAKAPKKD